MCQCKYKIHQPTNIVDAHTRMTIKQTGAPPLPLPDPPYPDTLLPDPPLPYAALPHPLLPESMGLAVPFDRLINDVEFGSNACNATMHA